jgi:transcriptional regulator GlxA family with amidase domain
MVAVTILALETALATSVAITIDVLAMANHCCHNVGRPSAFEVRLRGSGAHLFRPFLAFPEATHETPEIMIVPAQGFSKADNYLDRLAMEDARAARDEIAVAAGRGASVASSCTATLLVASTGLLDGRRATTAWWLAPTFRTLFPSVLLDTSELVLRDGLFVTAGAAMAQMDLMVGLVARYAGGTIADACTRKMILDERRSQTPYLAMGLLAAGNEHVARAAEWARDRLGDQIAVSDLSTAAGLSERTFARRVLAATGMPPVQFLQQLRIERAVEMLETTQLPFDEIAYRVGYSDASTLRGLLRRRLGVGPRSIRARARAAIGHAWG